MLQKCFELTDQLYNPINHLTQNELIEKFNLAFYKAQNLSKVDILSTFNETEEESLPDVTEMKDDGYTNDDYLIDYLISNSPLSTPGSEVDANFDFDDFVVDFDQSITQNGHQTKLFKNDNELNNVKVDYYDNGKQNDNFTISDTASNSSLENFGISFVDVDITSELINSSLEAEQLTSDIEQFEESIDDQQLSQAISNDFFSSGVNINKKNVDFNNFLRSFPAEELGASISYNVSIG